MFLLTYLETVHKVKDNGIGINEKDQVSIFDQFTQVSDTKLGKPKGSDLGLHISKQIAEQHGEVFV